MTRCTVRVAEHFKQVLLVLFRGSAAKGRSRLATASSFPRAVGRGRGVRFLGEGVRVFLRE